MKNILENKKINSIHDLNRINKKIKNFSISLYKKHFDSDIEFDILYKTYLSDLKEAIDEEFDKISENYENNRQSDEEFIDILLNDLSTKFSFKMNQILDSVDNEEELIAEHKSLKQQFINDFILNNKSIDKTLIDNKLITFHSYIDNILIVSKNKLIEKKDEVLNSYEIKLKESENIYIQV